MNEDNKIFKTNEISIEISPVKNTVDSQRAQYYSYDENSGLQRIKILKDGQPLGLPEGSQVRLSAVKLSGSKQMMIYTPEIEDRVKGIVTFVIPKEFLGYSGQIRCTLYIDFSSDQTLHAGYFYINMGISDIDANLPEFSDSYWQRWTDFESEATTKMQELERRIDEQTEIFNNADVYNKTEIEEKLEPFALRTDIDSLSIEKADKTALALTDSKVADLDSVKADKTFVDAQLAQKATYQTVFGMSNLNQEVKNAITGGSVAVVGKNAISKTNIVASAVTPAETNFIVRNVLSDTLVDDEKVQTGIYYEWNTGNIVERFNYNSTGLIPCIPNATYTRTLPNGQISFWDKNGYYVSGTNSATNIIVVPDDASIAYMRVAYAEIANFTVNKGETLLPKDTYNEEYAFSLPLETHRKLTELETITNGLSELTVKPLSKNLYNPVEKSSGGYYSFNSGVWNERADISSTGFIDARMGEKFIAYGADGYLGGNVTFWDSSHSYVIGANLSTDGTQPAVITIPNRENIRYFKISFPSATRFYQLNKGVEIQDYDEFEEGYMFEKNIQSPNILNIQDDLNLLNVQNSFTLKKTMSYQDDYSYSEYRGKDTTFWTTHINRDKFDGTVNYPKVRLTVEHIDDPNTKSVQQYVASNQHDLVINGGIFNMGTNITDGYLIIDGVIVQDKLSTTHMYQHTLAVMQNGTLRSFEESVSPTELLALGVQQAVVGFIPIIIDGEIPNDDFLKICPHSKIKNPRQVIGQYPNGDYIIFTCDGRREGEAGMALREAVEIMQKLGVSFAYNLDGGGSTQTFVSKKRINNLIENRLVPNVLVF